MFGRQIRKLRKQNRLTLKTLAKESGLSSSYLCDIENERCNPSVKALKKIARALNCSLAALIDSSPSAVPPVDEIGYTAAIPLLKEIKPRPYLFEPVNIKSYIPFSIHPSNAMDLFFFEIADDSMLNCRLCKGDLVLISLTTALRQGDLGMVIIKDNQPLVRKIYFSANQIILDTNHPQEKPLTLPQKEGARIIGKVIQAHISF